MRIKAYFKTKHKKKSIEDSLKWWNHYDTYGPDIMWDEHKDFYLIYGNAVCMAMALELKKKSGDSVELESFHNI